ncbi:hypothetical protein HER32_11950 [Hymenobacter sp. BT18]|uniref:hypothetical protein n=1 Tax=Hymenobacter sp. BT18 TaxID=2835648 RepID=UPI00143E4947|nr:hypothetical protein [Hymenobacter sp. BT18]QIX61855.1 hypothetical protein HER32_11950 [Hymenobacter sp. BT18]
MLTLFLDSQRVDLPDDASLALSYQASDLGSFASREASLSESFTLPLTNRNLRVLGLPHVLDSGTDTPYRMLPALLLENDVQLLEGIAILESAGEGYEVTLTSQEGALFSLVKDRGLRELDLSAYDHSLTFAQVQASGTHDPERGYLYPLYDDGRLTQRTTHLNGGNTIHFSELNPAVYSAVVLRQLVRETLGSDWTMNGTLLSDWRFIRHVLPCATPGPHHRPAYTDARKASAFKNSPQSNRAPEHGYVDPVVFFQDEVVDPGNVLIQLPFVATNYQLPGEYSDVRVQVSMVLRIEAPNFNEKKSTAPKVTARVISDYELGEEQTVLEGWGYLPGIFIYRNVVLDTTLSRLPPNGTVAVQLFIQDGLLVTVQPGAQVVFSLLPRAYPEGPVHLDASLPDISQGEFLQLLAVQFGALFQCDMATRTVRLDLLQDVDQRRAQARDWTYKLDLSRRPRLSYRLGDYAQRTTLAYADSPGETSLTDQYTGEGALLIPDATLERTTEGYTAPVALPLLRQALRQTTALAYTGQFASEIGRLLWVPGVLWEPGGYTFYKNRYYKAIRFMVWEPGTPPPDDEGGPVWELVSESVVHGSGQDSPTVALVTDLPSLGDILVGEGVEGFGFLPATTITPVGLDFAADLLPAYYPMLQRMLGRVQVLEVDVRLNAVDIAGLDFSYPILLNLPHIPGYGALQGYFYLNLIDQYNPGGTAPVACTLVSLNSGLFIPAEVDTDPVFVRVTEAGEAILTEAGEARLNEAP